MLLVLYNGCNIKTCKQLFITWTNITSLKPELKVKAGCQLAIQEKSDFSKN